MPLGPEPIWQLAGGVKCVFFFFAPLRMTNALQQAQEKGNPATLTGKGVKFQDAEGNVFENLKV